MNNKWPFKWYFIKPDGTEVPVEKFETHLFTKLKDDPHNPLLHWYLAMLYKYTARNDNAEQHIRQIRETCADEEKEAAIWLMLGCRMEKLQDFHAAVEAYKLALPLGSKDTKKLYYMHNNLGYSLIQIKKYKEAEFYCRKAIEIDGSLYNAHKNLGLSLEGQDKFTAAAQCYIRSTMRNSRDLRAFKHLDDLLKKHPEIEDTLRDEIMECYEHVRKTMTSNGKQNV